MIKQTPNIITLLNLFCGCLAICFALQTGLITTYDANTGLQIVEVPEKIFYSSVFIGIAAIVDFFDGFVARWLKASSALGKQLDSLSDVVSFGVAPAMIIYQFLRLSLAKTDDGLDAGFFWLLPAFALPCAGAYRLARFNIDDSQSTGFKGVPIPAAGLVLASFPLIYWHSNNEFIINLFTNKWFWYAVISIVSYLMISTLPLKALKFSSFSFKQLLPFLIIVLIAIASAIFLGWMAVPIGFISYIITSIIFKDR